MSSKGITIAEAILSLLVLTITVLAVFQLFPSALLAQTKTEQRRRAHLIAHTLLEEARAEPHSKLTPQAAPEVLYDLEQGGVSYRRSLWIQSVPGYTPDQLLCLEAVVSFRVRERDESVKRFLYMSATKL